MTMMMFTHHTQTESALNGRNILIITNNYKYIFYIITRAVDWTTNSRYTQFGCKPFDDNNNLYIVLKSWVAASRIGKSSTNGCWVGCIQHTSRYWLFIICYEFTMILCARSLSPPSVHITHITIIICITQWYCRYTLSGSQEIRVVYYHIIVIKFGNIRAM